MLKNGHPRQIFFDFSDFSPGDRASITQLRFNIFSYQKKRFASCWSFSIFFYNDFCSNLNGYLLVNVTLRYVNCACYFPLQGPHSMGKWGQFPDGIQQVSIDLGFELLILPLNWCKHSYEVFKFSDETRLKTLQSNDARKGKELCTLWNPKYPKGALRNLN